MDKKQCSGSLRLRDSWQRLFERLMFLSDKKKAVLFDEAIMSLFYRYAQDLPPFREEFIEFLQKQQENNGDTE